MYWSGFEHLAMAKPEKEAEDCASCGRNQEKPARFGHGDKAHGHESQECCWRSSSTILEFRVFAARGIFWSSRFHPPVSFHRATLVCIHSIELCYAGFPRHSGPRLRFSRN